MGDAGVGYVTNLGVRRLQPPRTAPSLDPLLLGAVGPPSSPHAGRTARGLPRRSGEREGDGHSASEVLEAGERGGHEEEAYDGHLGAGGEGEQSSGNWSMLLRLISQLG
ncbi:hypothetical protein ZWY2020_005510 [Hordeum vulgare]|nr:hypothetical protein ZWY2020_005510 [Hordeum vulgare]